MTTPSLSSLDSSRYFRKKCSANLQLQNGQLSPSPPNSYIRLFRSCNTPSFRITSHILEDVSVDQVLVVRAEMAADGHAGRDTKKQANPRPLALI